MRPTRYTSGLAVEVPTRPNTDLVANTILGMEWSMLLASLVGGVLALAGASAST
jgi:hypothetical protein